jgi:hypothetical protein
MRFLRQKILEEGLPMYLSNQVWSSLETIIPLLRVSWKPSGFLRYLWKQVSSVELSKWSAGAYLSIYLDRQKSGQGSVRLTKNRHPEPKSDATVPSCMVLRCHQKLRQDSWMEGPSPFPTRMTKGSEDMPFRIYRSCQQSLTFIQ